MQNFAENWDDWKQPQAASLNKSQDPDYSDGWKAILT